MQVKQVIKETDVLYVTRVQKERFTDLAQYDAMKHFYIIGPKLLEDAKKKMIVMHPLPRVGEIEPEVDADSRAAYFRQAECGLYVRMALLGMTMGKL